MSKIDKSQVDAEIAASIKKFSQRAKSENTRELTQGYIEMPEFVRQKAQLLSAHFLLPAGGRVVDMGCEKGEITYMLAALNPRLEIIGVDNDAEAINFARRTYQLPNLKFFQSDISIPEIPDESLDGIINSNILHHIYSLGGYDPAAVADLLEKQVRKLKAGGTMLVRDYVRPPEGDTVLLELPDVPSTGESPAQMSDADLLISFSQGARPMEAGAEGFFIEEIPSMREETRLFRLDHKWALEFIHRKDYRINWQAEMKEEYTFFTLLDYRREFTKLGMRMVFSAPYWNPWVVKNFFKGRFQMYTEEGDPMEFPSTNHFIVSQKVADKQSLVLEERRPSTAPLGDLEIVVVRDKKTGEIHEMVKRPGEHCDIVPWRKTSDDRVVMYVRGGYPRPIVNAAQRGSHNLDGKKWSGHLIEPVTMDTVDMGDDAEENRQMIFAYVENYASLRTKDEENWYVGDTFYPSPDRIDEAIEPVFIEVEDPQKTAWPIAGDTEVRFVEPGTIIELDAADVVLASQVGLLPDPRLEMYAFELMVRNGVALPAWIGEKMPKLPGQAPPSKTPEDLLRELEPTEFEEVRLAPTKLKRVKSVFVEEGKVGRATRGLSAQDVEFVVTEDGIENIALVVPLSRDWDNNLLVALEPKIMPVPNRLGTNGAMLNVPSFVLPKDVKSINDAKNWVAARFCVPPENVGQLGESYFSHTGVTPQRIYPFYVASTGGGHRGPGAHQYPASFSYLLNLLFFQSRAENNLGALYVRAVARITMFWMSADHGMAPERSFRTQRYKDFALSTQKEMMDSKHEAYGTPSRVKGERVAATSAKTGEDIEQNVRRRKEANKLWESAEPAHESLLARDRTMVRESVGLTSELGLRLSQTYAQAKAPDGDGYKISMKEAPSFAKLDKRLAEMSAKKRDDEDLKVSAPASQPAPAPPGGE